MGVCYTELLPDIYNLIMCLLFDKGCVYKSYKKMYPETWTYEEEWLPFLSFNKGGLNLKPLNMHLFIGNCVLH